MMRISGNNIVDTVTKLVVVAAAMFAFVFVVMVPLYDVLCDALGINGKPAGDAYVAASTDIDESREITVQFVATNNENMPWAFSPSVTMMKVHPGAANDTVFYAATRHPVTWRPRRYPVFRHHAPLRTFIKPSVFALTSSRCKRAARRICLCSLSSIRRCLPTLKQLLCPTRSLM